MFKFSSILIWRLGSRCSLRMYASPGATVCQNDQLDSTKSDTNKNAILADEGGAESSGLVAAVFASLNSPEVLDITKKPSPKSAKQNIHQQIELQISKAKDVNSLLLVGENSIVSRRHALKVVSVLSEWLNSNKVKIGEFERDPRFLKLCRILARSSSNSISPINRADDLNTVLGITGDDEAAGLITNLSLSQMIKVMQALHQKGRRSIPLMRAVANNISKKTEVIDLKKSADLLFSMVSLSFPDPVLLDRICKDVIECLPDNTDKPAVVTSIAVSLGLLRYRHEPALTAIADWLRKSKGVCRGSDLASVVVTLASVNFIPPDSDELFEAALLLKEEEMAKPSAWLDLVFSLLTLDKANEDQLLSTLKPEFIERLLSAGEIPIPSRRKLMAIDAWVGARCPSAHRLPEEVAVAVPVVHTKDKMLYVNSIMDTINTLVSSARFIRKDCNSGMGFLYDAEFAVDANCHPVPLDKAAENKNVFRIAVMGLDYHDMTRRTAVPLGCFSLYERLLNFKGYKVLQIPYTEYNPKDKLLTRVKYIEQRLKELVSIKS